MRLTKLSFSRNPLDWLTFWDSFQAAIHLNPNLSGIQKFNYLKSQLQGDAARCIDGIPLSDQNYLHAITLLRDHFGQTHKLVSAHMQAFIEAPNPTNILNSFMTQWRAIRVVYRHLGNPSRTMVTCWYQLFLASYPRTPYRPWQEAPHLQTGNFRNSCQPFAERLKSLKLVPPILMNLRLQLLSW